MLLVIVLSKHVCSHRERFVCQPLFRVIEHSELEVDRPYRQHSVTAFGVISIKEQTEPR